MSPVFYERLGAVLLVAWLAALAGELLAKRNARKLAAAASLNGHLELDDLEGDEEEVLA